MSEHGRGTFSCRIDGRAGYLRLFDDRIELLRSGRGPAALGPEILPMHQVTRIAVTKPGRLLSTVELATAAGAVELKFPSIDAPRVADLIELLARDAVPPAEIPAQSAYAVELPVAVGAYAAPSTAPSTTLGSYSFAPEAAEPAEPATFAAPAEEPVEPWVTGLPIAAAMAKAAADPVVSAFVVPAAADEEGRAFEVSTIRIPELVIPEILMPEWRPLPQEDEPEPMPALVVPKVTMPEWTPLPETEEHEMVLSQIVIDELRPWSPAPEPSASAEPLTEIAPLPDGSVLAAAAALAELEDLLSGLEDVPEGEHVVRSVDGDPAPVELDAQDDIVAMAREILAPAASIPSQPSEAALTLAAAALLSGARPHAEEPAPRPVVERPAEMSPELTKRLARLETLRSCGVMSDEDFALHESQIFELAWAEQNGA